MFFDSSHDLDHWFGNVTRLTQVVFFVFFFNLVLFFQFHLSILG
jgi:hypothetical protein